MSSSFAGGVPSPDLVAQQESQRSLKDNATNLTGISSATAAQGVNIANNANNLIGLSSHVADDARNYDSQANQDKAAGRASADVNQAFSKSQAMLDRNLSRNGVNPSSGAAISAQQDAQIARAAQESGAMTNARQATIDKGIGLRSTAVSQGNTLAGTANNSAGTAINGLNAATGALTGRASVGQGINADRQKEFDANQNAMAGNANMAGSVVGSVIGAIAGSSKKIKEDKRPIDDSATLSSVKSLPVEKWKYKDGVEDSGEHVGAYAEDVQKKFGDSAAPGGKAIDIVSMIGIGLSATKGLAKQVDALDKKVAVLTKKAGLSSANTRSA